jgi:uncharacterized protein (TIGR00255 family)
MITSMTGFASASRDRDDVSVTVTVRAVNHRFLDLQIRVPAMLASFENTIRGLVQKRVARGRVEVSIAVQDRRRRAVDVALNHGLIQGVSAALLQAREEGFIAGNLTPSDLLRLPDALTIREHEGESTHADRVVMTMTEEAVEAALHDLEVMRKREGGFLQADLESRRLGLAETIARLAAAAHEGQAALEARLARRVSELTLEAAPDGGVLAQEIVRFAARSDISEEVVRFRAHLEHWALLTSGPEPCGRKLDFLLQEMNREINTIGAKAEGTRVPELIVHAKAELEKMREQVQNVE